MKRESGELGSKLAKKIEKSIKSDLNFKRGPTTEVDLDLEMGTIKKVK